LAVVAVGSVPAFAGSVELAGVDVEVLEVLDGETPPLAVDSVVVAGVVVVEVVVAGVVVTVVVVVGVVSVFGGGVVWL